MLPGLHWMCVSKVCKNILLQRTKKRLGSIYLSCLGAEEEKIMNRNGMGMVGRRNFD